jgi:hypothetical protein
LKPELGRRLSAVLKPLIKVEFGSEVRTRLEPDFKTEVKPVLIAVLKGELRSVLNADLRAEFTPGVTPMCANLAPAFGVGLVCAGAARQRAERCLASAGYTAPALVAG